MAQFGWTRGSLVCLIASLLSYFVSAMDYDLGMEYFGMSTREFQERIPRLLDLDKRDFDLSKRDVCTDAIPGTISQTCSPSDTLCCVPQDSSIAYPQCETILSQGFCCVSSTGCYIDTESACGQSNSVSCPLLEEGTNEACCPAFTSCPDNFNQSSTVRCNINQNAISSSSTSISTSTSTLTSTSTTSSSTSSSTTTTTSTSTSSSLSASSSNSGTSAPLPAATSSASSPNPNSENKSTGLSGGAAAGIGIGAAIAVVILAALGIFLYRRGKKQGEQQAANERNAAFADGLAGEQAGKPGGFRQSLGLPGYAPVYQGQPMEQMSPYQKFELPATHEQRPPAELS